MAFQGRKCFKKLSSCKSVQDGDSDRHQYSINKIKFKVPCQSVDM